MSFLSPVDYGRSGLNQSVNRVTLPTITDIDQVYDTLEDIGLGVNVGFKAGVEDDELVVVLCKNGSSELTPYLQTESVQNIIEEDTITEAGGSTAEDLPKGTYDIPIDVSGSVAANYYQHGHLWVIDGTGAPMKLQIASNTASASNEIIVTLEAPLPRALAGTGSNQSHLRVLPSLFTNIRRGTFSHHKATGVPAVTIPANKYYWSIIKGDFPARAHEAITATTQALVVKAADGEIALADAVTDVQVETIGQVRTGSAIATDERVVVSYDIKFLGNVAA